MAPPLDPVAGDPDQPASTQVVVIGGGIVGVCTALYLARKGIPVVLCEKGVVGGEQSSRNWGWCRKMGRDVAEIPLAIESLRLWERLAERTGVDVGFRKNGILYLCENENHVARRQKWLEGARPFGIDTRLVGA